MYLLKLELELQNLMKKIPVPSEAINKMSTEFPQIEMFVVSTLFHYSQYASRNNNWPLIQQHRQWKEFQRGIWWKMFQMHHASNFCNSYFLGPKLIHCIHNKVLQIFWKLYFKIFHIRKKNWWILSLTNESNN